MSSSCHVQNCSKNATIEDSGSNFVNSFCDFHGELAENTIYDCFRSRRNAKGEFVPIDEKPVGGYHKN